MKERVIIMAAGGASGHFISTLIQTLHVPDWFTDLEVPGHGCMDMIAESGSLIYGYALSKKGYSFYPERPEAMDFIMNAFKNPEATYKPYQSKYEKEFHEIHVLHYQWQKHVYKFLSLPDTKVIFVRYNADSHKRIAVNKITKNLTKGAILSDDITLSNLKTSYESLLTWAGQSTPDLIDELRSLTSLDITFISKSLITALIKAYEMSINERSIHCNPRPHKNMLILNFNDIYFNKEIIMESLSELTGQPINATTRLIYDDYLANQPNIDLY